MDTTIANIQIKVKITNKPPLLGQAEVIIGNIIEIKGWRVSQSNKIHPKFQEMIWIQPPCYRAGITWKPVVFINDKKLYEEVEEAIYNEYQHKIIEEVSGSSGNKESVNPEDIPF